MPVLSFAQENMALTKTHTTYSNYSTSGRQETAFRVPYAVVGHAMPAQQEDSYTVGVWFQLKAYCSASPYTSSNKRAVIFRLASPDHLNLNGNVVISVNTDGEIVISGHNGANEGGAGTAGINIIGTVSGATVSLDTWYHMVLAVDNTAHRIALYLNGDKVKEWSTTVSMVYGGTTGWNDGVFSIADYGFTGYLDEVQFWNRGLSDEEVKSANVNALAVNGLTALYTFNTNATTQPNTAPNAQAGTDGIYKLYTAGSWFDDGLTGVNSSWQTSWSEVEASSMDLVAGRELPATEVTVTVTDGEGGTLSLSDGTTTYAAGAHTILTGTELTVTATPTAGYDLLGITATTAAGTTAIDNGGNYIVVGDVEITASYSNDHQALTVVAPDNVTVALTRDGQSVTDLTALTVGADYSFTVAVPEGKRIVSVKLGEGALTPVDGVYSFTFEGAATITVEVEDIPQYVVTVEQPANGTVAATYAYNGATGAVVSGQSYYEGTVLTLSNTPAEGYSLANYLVNGSAYSESTVTLTANATISAVFEELPDACIPVGLGKYGDYCQRTDKRGISSITVASGSSSITLTAGISSNRLIYSDQTSSVLEVEPGSTVALTVAGSGSWMQNFIYADFNKGGLDDNDKVFDNMATSNVSGVGNTIAGTYSFTVPANVAPGRYLVRYMLNWDDDGPCQFGQAGSDNGEYVIDFMLEIPSHDLENPRTVTVASENETYGTVAITSPATDEKSLSTKQETVTVKATPAAGYSFLNWTDATDAVVSTDATYVYNGAVDATLTAHFGYAITYSATGNGTLSVKAGDVTIASGTVVAVGTEVTVEAVPQDGYAAQAITVDGVEVENNPYVFTPTAAANITVNFIEATYSLSVNIIGEGTVTVSETTDDTGLIPAGNIYQNGDYISQNLPLCIFFEPNDGFELSEGVIDGIQENNGSISSTDEEYTDNGDGTWGTTYFIRTADSKKYVAYVTGNGDVNVTATFAAAGAAIEGIEADGSDAPVEYYNLQGVRVAADNLATGFYICRQGEKARKVFIKK